MMLKIGERKQALRKKFNALLVGFALLGLTGISLSDQTTSAIAAPVATSSASPNYLTDTSLNIGAQAASMRIGDELNASSGKKMLAAETSDLLAPAGYAGEAIIPTGLQISLAGTPSAALVAQIRKAASPVGVTIRRVARSEAQLDATIGQITKDEAKLGAMGASPSRWGIDYAANKVEVWLTRYSPAAASAVRQRYGSGLVEVAGTSAPLAQRYTRTIDNPPWWGGDRLVDTYTGSSCSGGFPMTDGIKRYVMTAAHCSGTTGSGALNQTLANNGVHVGTITNRSFINNGDLDVEMAAAASGAASTVYSGPASSSDSRTVVSVATADPTGAEVCTDGSYTGEVCAVKIKNSGLCIKFVGGVTTCGLVFASRSGVTVAEDGDSGGPVETTIGSNETAAQGEIIGGASPDNVYYTPMYRIVNSMHLTVLVSG